MVAAILLTVLSPLVVLSTSYRVQARRVDLATQAARSYIDGLRSDSIGPPSDNSAIFSQTDDLNVVAPQVLPTDPGTCLDKNLNSIVCNDPANKPFLVIQAFRNGPPAEDLDGDSKYDPIPAGYCVGVRVYRGDAFDGGGYPDKIQPPKSGLSNTKDAPLVVMRAEIINQTSFDAYSDRITASGNSPCG